MSETSPHRVGTGRFARGTFALIALRVAYAYNWLDVGPALPAIGASFSVTPTGWGLLIASFLVGAGLFQVPAGLLSRKWGTRRVSLYGALLLGVSALACAAAPTFAVLLLLRLAAGAGAGLFFSPAIALVASMHSEGERGIPVGTFSSAFSAGAGLGVFASALLVPIIGWRGALAAGGLILLASLLVAQSQIPLDAGAPPPGSLARGGRRTEWPAALRSRGVWAIGLAFTGLEGASMAAGQYFVPYAQLVRGWSPVLAGAVGALFVFPSVFGGPVGGRLAERRTNRRTQLFLFTAVPAALVALVPFAGLAETIVIAATFSFSYGMVYAIMYILPPYLPGLTIDDAPLAIGLLNAIQLFGGAVIASTVGFVVEGAGFAPAFVLIGAVTIATLIFLVGVPATGARGTVGEP